MPDWGGAEVNTERPNFQGIPSCKSQKESGGSPRPMRVVMGSYCIVGVNLSFPSLERVLEMS